MNSFVSLLLAVTLAFGEAAVAAAAPTPGMENFRPVAVYSDGQFADVAPESWFQPSVERAYELGLVSGEEAGLFNGQGQVTVVQAIVMAARLHKIYYTGSGQFDPAEPWYQPYVDYAREAGILTQEPELFAAATRAQFVDLLARALPGESLAPINEIGDNAIPDVKADTPCAGSIYTLYRAGVVTGDFPRGAFRPQSGISRAEAAAILARMADESLRQSFTLTYNGPDLAAQAWMDDSFFENAAILGNSLVDGLRMFSDLHSLHYFCATSVSVTSAATKRDTLLKDGTRGTLVEAICQEPYDRIYIELGINEIGSPVEDFIRRYGAVIDTIQGANPGTDIYILSVLPVTRSKSNSGGPYTMPRVNMYNEALHQLAADKQCYYMDVCSAFLGEDGYLPSGWSSDGVHLYAKYYAIWEACMRTLY